jgi:hypothetical protein
MKILARTIQKSEADNQRRGSDHHDYHKLPNEYESIVWISVNEVENGDLNIQKVNARSISN